MRSSAPCPATPTATASKSFRSRDTPPRGAAFFLPHRNEGIPVATRKTKAGSTARAGRAATQGSTGKTVELHQVSGGDHPSLTTNQCLPIGDNQNSLRAHPRGPTLLEDFILREKITHFDHERIPERIVHARGTGAHGFFELTQSLSQYTKADFLQRVGDKIPVFVRFSTVAGGAGSGDLPRDVR